MLQLLETGRALYALAALCVLGILTRMVTRHVYKRLLKESNDLSLTRNKSLKELRQRAENTYRVNQGLVDSGGWSISCMNSGPWESGFLPGAAWAPGGRGSVCCLAEQRHFFLTGIVWIPIM